MKALDMMRDEPRVFDFAALYFACFWGVEELRRDLDILIRCGRVQASAQHEGRDNPSTWFRLAARAYTTDDEIGVLAHRACLAVAVRLAEHAPS